jgi:hypothetical protein
MNKNLLIIGAIVLVVAIGGYLLLNKGANPLSQTSSPQNAEQQANMIIKAFEGSGSVKCTYEDESGSFTTYIKNGKVRVESSGSEEGKNGNVIMKNDTLWTWETGSSEGFMMKNVSQNQDDPNVPEEDKMTAEEIRNEIEQNQAQCMNENIQDSMFDPPANVVFQDFSAMMEEVQTQMPKDFELPEGVELPEGFEYPSN